MRFEDEAERQLHARVAVLGPSDQLVSRMQVRVVDGYERRPTSLWREWLGLLQARPVVNGALVVMAAALVLFSSPLGAVLRALTAVPTPVAVVTPEVRDEIAQR